MATLEFRQSSFRDFLHVIFKRKNQILLFFAVTVCTVVIGTFLSKPAYQANAQILVKMGRESLYIPMNSTNSQILNFNRDNQINTEIELLLLKGQSLAEKVIKSLGPETIYKNLDLKGAVLNFQKSLEAETKNRTLQVRQQLDKTPETLSQGKEVDHNPYLIRNLEARLVEFQLKEKELLIKHTSKPPG